jgi:ABC-type amino acid transport substrate-binding protein
MTTIVVAVLIVSATARAVSTIELVGFNYPPFYSETYLDGKGHGFVSDIVTSAFDAMNVEAIITYQPVARSAQSFKTGRYVAYVGSKEAFLSAIDVSEVDILSLCTYYNRLHYFGSQVSKDLTDAEIGDLQGYRIGDVVGSHLVGDLRASGLNVELSPQLEQGMMKLAGGRIDLWVAVGLTAYFLVEKHMPERLGDLTFVIMPVGTGTVDLSFLKSHKDYLKMKGLYEEGLATIFENGVYEAILKRYFGEGIVFEDALSSCT